jgi:hypothetical protein
MTSTGVTRLDEAIRLVESRRCPAQLCVIADGKVVLDHSVQLPA